MLQGFLEIKKWRQCFQPAFAPAQQTFKTKHLLVLKLGSLMRLTTVCIFLLLLLTGCYQQTNQQTTESTEQTSTEQTSPETTVSDKDAMSDKEAFAADAFQQVQSGTAILVDVRSDEEWNESHFEVAKHIPIDKIKEEPEVAFESIDKEQTVFLH